MNLNIEVFDHIFEISLLRFSFLREARWRSKGISGFRFRLVGPGWTGLGGFGAAANPGSWLPAQHSNRGFFFPQHLVEGLFNFRRRVCRSFWLDLAFQDTPGKTDQ